MCDFGCWTHHSLVISKGCVWRQVLADHSLVISKGCVWRQVLADHRLVISKGCVWLRVLGTPLPRGLCVATSAGRPPPRHLQGLCVATSAGRPPPRHLQGLCVAPSARHTTASWAVCGAKCWTHHSLVISKGCVWRQVLDTPQPRHLQGLCVAPSAGQTTASSSPRAVCGAECWADHRIVVSKLNLLIQPKRRPQGMKTPERLNVNKLKLSCTKLSFTGTLEQRIDATTLDNHVESPWAALRKTV